MKLLIDFLEEEKIRLTGKQHSTFQALLSPRALEFLVKLHRRFNARRKELLAKREDRQKETSFGIMPGFLSETKHVREGEWEIGPVPLHLLERKVEVAISASSPKLEALEAVNADTLMLSFESICSLTWENVMNSHLKLYNYISNRIDAQHEEQLPVIFVSPRGWHLTEKHMIIDGEEISASLFDYGLYLYNNIHALRQNGQGAYFTLPKIEGYMEASLWNEVFEFTEEVLHLPKGSIKAQVIIETVHAAYQMHEILYELSDYACGLQLGIHDYIFSFIKKFRHLPEFILPDRVAVVKNASFISVLAQLLVKTCHTRNALAIASENKFLPGMENLEEVKKTFEKEVKLGFDGTCVSDLTFVDVAREQFERFMPHFNQVLRVNGEFKVQENELLTVPEGSITRNGMQENIECTLKFLEAWISGNAAESISDKHWDVSMVEIARSQIWQWIQCPHARLDDGTAITYELYKAMLLSQLRKIKEEIGESGYNKAKFEEAADIFDILITSDNFHEFFIQVAYKYLP
ncbi:malate synthase A [Rapidithrix thailandica]|uniref:malate synthase n=1 Tax=Rapidithrix thailandica TaxID=413964 RepID=A0AAW9SCK1_9BACT